MTLEAQGGRRAGGGAAPGQLEPELTAAFMSASAAETQELGAALGALLRAGDVVALQGDLGAGKTIFVKGVAAGLGLDPDEVTSPTFTLVHAYPGRAGRSPFFHVDLYRIERPEALEGIGWDEAVGGRGVAAVEWAERAGAWLPADRLDVHLVATAETTRRIAMTARGERPRGHLQALLGSPPWASRRLCGNSEGGKQHGGEG